MPKFQSTIWQNKPYNYQSEMETNKKKQLKGIGNAQSPIVAATAFRILINRLINIGQQYNLKVSIKELEQIFTIKENWTNKQFGKDFGFVHTPTTMANYSAPSMMKHKGCRNFVKVFKEPNYANAEYLGLVFLC